MSFAKNIHALDRRNSFLKQVRDSNSVDTASAAGTVPIGVEIIIGTIS